MEKRRNIFNNLAGFAGIVLILTAILSMLELENIAFWVLVGSCALYYLSYIVRTVIEHKKEIASISNTTQISKNKRKK